MLVLGSAPAGVPSPGEHAHSRALLTSMLGSVGNAAPQPQPTANRQWQGVKHTRQLGSGAPAPVEAGHQGDGL